VLYIVNRPYKYIYTHMYLYVTAKCVPGKRKWEGGAVCSGKVDARNLLVNIRHP